MGVGEQVGRCRVEIACESMFQPGPRGSAFDLLLTFVNLGEHVEDLRGRHPACLLVVSLPNRNRGHVIEVIGTELIAQVACCASDRVLGNGELRCPKGQ